MPAQAQDDWHHYGLAAPIYTHFTSPIRRYADVVVHRLLAASIGVAPLPTQLMSKVSKFMLFQCVWLEVCSASIDIGVCLVLLLRLVVVVQSLIHELAENMNRRHRSAQLAGRASVSLHTQVSSALCSLSLSLFACARALCVDFLPVARMPSRHDCGYG